MTTVYLTVTEVLAIHDDQIECYGGANGVCDPGQLEAALFRPQTGCYSDVIAEAAALWESLSAQFASVGRSSALSRHCFACHEMKQQPAGLRACAGSPAPSLASVRTRCE